MPLHRQLDDTDVRPRLDPLLATWETPGALPKLRIPEGATSPEIAARLVRSDLILDGNARLNLATFVTTWMEPEARALMAETADKNMIDKDEYPQTAELEMRCVNILADLCHARSGAQAIGTSTTGSSEAAMLGGMALLWRWRARRRAAGKPTDKPNLVTGINVQVCWEKFCRYWDVEARLVPMEGDTYHLTAAQAAEHCDDNTIGVVTVLGSTFDGSYEPVADICAALDKLQADTGLDVPVHVDGASGGFIAPFIDADLVWDFRLPRVQSINASGHKYGLVYPGVGWIVWRNPDALPDDLVFNVNYLGGNMPTFALNFSRPGAQVAAQYFTFLRLGFEGYRRVQQACRDTAQWLAGEVAAMEPFELVSDGSALPVFAFRMAEDVTRYSVYDVSEMLRVRGWIVPAYKMPKGIEESVLRVVVRNGFSWDMARMLLADLATTTERLERTGGDPETSGRAGFHH